MRKVTAELTVYVIDDGSKRRVYRTDANPNKRSNRETPYFYIGRDGKNHYLSEIEVMSFPATWQQSIPVRNK